MHRFDRAELVSRPEQAFARRRGVAFQDVDAAGIVFFGRIFEYAHDAYAELLAEAGHPLAAVLKEGVWAAPIRHAEADYLRPLRFGDEMDVAIVKAVFAPSELCLGTRIGAIGATEPAALVQTVHTFVDRRSFQRMPVPGDLQEAIIRLVGSAAG
jgi:YbgC/YbaW family acyl-CoA thioester hydrolase